MNNQEFLDILQQFVTKYDKQNRSYPESETNPEPKYQSVDYPKYKDVTWDAIDKGLQ